jgi:amino acid transporter
MARLHYHGSVSQMRAALAFSPKSAFPRVGTALAASGRRRKLIQPTYSVVGSMMIALGEMTTLYPVSGAFTHYTARFVDPALGFALGWNYWYSYAITLPTVSYILGKEALGRPDCNYLLTSAVPQEITAAALVIQYWRDDINVAVWITVFLVVICSFNFFGVKWYGEAEFWYVLALFATASFSQKVK